MKNIINFLAVALVMFTVISCDKNEILPDNSLGDVITLSATIGTGDTKTSLGNDFSVLWSEGDAIAVIQGNKVFEFSLVSGAGTISGVFVCENHEGFQSSQAFQAFYPYELVSVNGWNEVKYDVPSVQSYVANTFAPKVAPMAASGTIGESLMFTNLFSVLKLQIKGDEKVNEIDVVSMVDMNMNGPAILSFPQDGTPCIAKWEWKNTETRSVKLNCGDDGVQLNNDEYTDFMIMIPPGKQGWAVVIKTEQNTYYKSSSKVYDVAVGKILTMSGFALSEVNKATANSYVENGVYLGEGIKVDNLYWAPVNCGYEKAIGDYKGYTWGKLYQWSRDQGCGFPDDASLGVFKSSFYVGDEWSDNPCPDDWRVPTKTELQSLKKSLNSENLEEYKGQNGFWYGSTTTENLIFFQTAGYRDAMTGMAEGRGQSCLYWSSTRDAGFWVLRCKSGAFDTYSYTIALPVRCVKNVDSMSN